MDKGLCPILPSVKIIEKVEAFVVKHRQLSVVAFTNGATSESEVGRGSAAAVFLTLESVDDNLEVSSTKL